MSEEQECPFHFMQHVVNDWGEEGVVTLCNEDAIWVRHDYGEFRYAKDEWDRLTPRDD